MRITCHSMDDFLVNIKGESLFLNRVYLDKTKNAIDNDRLKFEVFLSASAVLDFGEDGQALLQYTEDCGYDLKTSDGHINGTNRQNKLIERLLDYCEPHQIAILPGVLDQ